MATNDEGAMTADIDRFAQFEEELVKFLKRLEQRLSSFGDRVFKAGGTAGDQMAIDKFTEIGKLLEQYLFDPFKGNLAVLRHALEDAFKGTLVDVAQIKAKAGLYNVTGDELRGYGANHDNALASLTRWLGGVFFKPSNGYEAKTEAFAAPPPEDGAQAGDEDGGNGWFAKLGASWQKLKDEFSTVSRSMTEPAAKASQQIQAAFQNYLFDPFHGGLERMLQSFSKTLREFAAKAAASALFRWLGSMLSGYGGGGLLGSLASFGGNVLTTAGNAVGGISGAGASGTAGNSDGGAAGGTTASKQIGTAAASLFTSSLPTFNQTARVAMPSAMGGDKPRVMVNVENHSNSEAHVEKQQQPNGDELYRVFIGKAQKDISRDNGPLARTIQSTYGVNRSGARR